jgi:hypothetical protein
MARRLAAAERTAASTAVGGGGGAALQQRLVRAALSAQCASEEPAPAARGAAPALSPGRASGVVSDVTGDGRDACDGNGCALAEAELVDALRHSCASALAACWRGFWARRQFVSHQRSTAHVLRHWRQAAVSNGLPRLPAALTTRTACVSRARLLAYTACCAVHACIIVVSFLWEQVRPHALHANGGAHSRARPSWSLTVLSHSVRTPSRTPCIVPPRQATLWSAPAGVALSHALLSLLTLCLSTCFCGSIFTMEEPTERHNALLAAIAPLHHSLLGVDAHRRASRRRAVTAAAASAAADAAAALALSLGPRRGLLAKAFWPRVAVLIPCYKEPDAIIAATVAGCLRLAYPAAALRVFVLDDSAAVGPEREARKATLEARYATVFGLGGAGGGTETPAHKRPGFSIVNRPDNSHAKVRGGHGGSVCVSLCRSHSSHSPSSICLCPCRLVTAPASRRET